MGQNVSIQAAAAADAEQILKLQYLCYQSEAALYNDYSIDPLTQSLESLRAEFETHTVFVAKLGDEVVGSVRGRVDGGAGRIGRLIVHPRLRGHLLGTRLMRAVEQELGTERFELCTGHRSEDNLRLYRRLGYTPERSEPVSPRLSLIHLAKSAVLAGV
jgi:ribosomal protein S18 acetylase RimI-like enzyme